MLQGLQEVANFILNTCLGLWLVNSSASGHRYLTHFALCSSAGTISKRLVNFGGQSPSNQKIPLIPQLIDITQRRTKESPLAEHFNGKGHTLVNIYSHDSCLHKIQESRWIRTLGTSHPFKMNLRVDSLRNLHEDYLWTA